MKNALPMLAVAALVSLPALAQSGPGVGGSPEPTAAPAATAPRPGPGFGSSERRAPSPAATPAPTATPRPPVYDEAADAKKEVAAAVAKARAEKKRVLVTLGGNWCGWCRALDELFRTDEKVSAELARAYVPVKVDVGRMTKNLDLAASWGADPKKGVPLLVVLDGKGKAVKVQETGSLEAGKGHDPAKVLAFLKSNAGA